MNVIQGCTCCGGCTIAADDFNRSNNDINVGAPFTWTKNVTGTAFADVSIFGNRVAFFYDVEGKLTCPTSSPDGSGAVSCTFETVADGEFFEVWLNGTDDENCTVARLTVGASATLKIISRVSNVDSTEVSVSISASAGGTYELKLYYSAIEKTAYAIVDDDDAKDACALEIEPAGDLSGISIGPHTETDLYADDFLYQKLGDGVNGCPELPNGACPHGTCIGHLQCCREVPDFLDLTIPPGTFVNDNCASCVGVSGTYTLERNISTVWGGAATNTWTYFEPSFCAVHVDPPGSPPLATSVDLLIYIIMQCFGSTCSWFVNVIFLPRDTGPIIGSGSTEWDWSLIGEDTFFRCFTQSHELSPVAPSVQTYDFCDRTGSPGNVNVGPH